MDQYKTQFGQSYFPLIFGLHNINTLSQIKIVLGLKEKI